MAPRAPGSPAREKPESRDDPQKPPLSSLHRPDVDDQFAPQSPEVCSPFLRPSASGGGGVCCSFSL